MAAVCGPILSPVIGGFAAMNSGWRWPVYELIFASGFSLAFSVSSFSFCPASPLVLWASFLRSQRILVGSSPLLKTVMLIPPVSFAVLATP